MTNEMAQRTVIITDLPLILMPPEQRSGTTATDSIPSVPVGTLDLNLPGHLMVMVTRFPD
jgi:hypothetical protein